MNLFEKGALILSGIVLGVILLIFTYCIMRGICEDINAAWKEREYWKNKFARKR
jgi:hypothetical protein